MLPHRLPKNIPSTPELKTKIEEPDPYDHVEEQIQRLDKYVVIKNLYDH